MDPEVVVGGVDGGGEGGEVGDEGVAGDGAAHEEGLHRGGCVPQLRKLAEEVTAEGSEAEAEVAAEGGAGGVLLLGGDGAGGVEVEVVEAGGDEEQFLGPRGWP